MKGYFRKRGDKWSFTIDIGRDPVTGKRKQKTRSGFKTKKEAQAACAELITEIETGSYIDPSKVPLKTFLEDYIKNNVEPKRRVGTTKNYKRIMRLYIVPHLGDMALKDIQPIHVQKYYTKMLENLAPGSVKIHHDLLNQAFDKAVEWKWLRDNPAKLAGSPYRESPERKIWTIEQCFYFLEHNRRSNRISSWRNHMIYLLILFTGLRRGEVLGIAESNINFKTNEIAITQQVILDEYDRPSISTTLKSKSSKRIVDVPPSVMDELRRFILEFKKNLLKRGKVNDTGLVFVSDQGKLLHPNNLDKMFRLSYEALNLPPIHFHDLRHCHVEILNALEVNPKAISQRLGHKDVNVTLDTYTHLTPRIKQKVSLALEKLYQDKTM